MQIKMLKVTSIKPYWRNPRNNDKAIDAVAESIKEYGFNQPIVLDSDNVIIAGHSRYKAAKQLGLEDVPTFTPENMTPEQAREYRLADNKTNELAEWNYGELIPELREILDVSKMQVYFGAQDLESILQESIGNSGKGAQNSTTAQIEKKAQDMADKFQGARNTEMLEMTCPHCNESFNVDKNYVMELMGITADGNSAE